MYGGATSTAFLLNFNTYQYYTASFATTYYDSSSAEYIYETMNGMYSSGLDIPFVACDYEESNGVAGNLSNSNYTEVIMTSNGKSNGYQYAYPTSVSNSSFNVIVP
jgi:hypothetical protein